MKLPFFNRKRYIVLKCYTDTKFHLDNCPVTLSSELPPMKPLVDVRHNEATFSTCYGYIKAMKKSAVLCAWTEMEFQGEGDLQGVSYRWADNCNGRSEVTPQEDAVYKVPNAVMTKLTNPWRVEETTGVHFVTGKHIRNMTPMAIPSGMQDFSRAHQINIFNLVTDTQPRYGIKFKQPLLAIYPVSDLPLHVECYYDIEKHRSLDYEAKRRGYFRANFLKLDKEK